MGKSAQGDDPPWTDLPKRQWEVLWEGETTWKKYGALLWEGGYKTVTLFPGAYGGGRDPDPACPGSQCETDASGREKDYPSIPKQREANAIPSQEVGERICDLIHEPSSPILLEGLEEVKGLLKKGTPTSWIRNLAEGFWQKNYGRRKSSNKETFLYPQAFKQYGTS